MMRVTRRSDFDFKIMKGSGGTVYRMGNFAVKRIKRDNIRIIEIAISLHLDHPGICHSSGYIINSTHIDVYLPLAFSDSFRLLPHGNYKRWRKELILATYHLHQHNIIHGDIKPSNILVFSEDGKQSIKLTDFGSSVLSGRERVMGDRCSPSYRPIECTTRGMKKYKGWDSKVDVWCIGCTLYYWKYGESLIPHQEISDLHTPEYDKKHTNVLLDLSEDHIFPHYRACYNPISNSVRMRIEDDNIIRSMLTVNPHKRVSLEDLIHENYRIPESEFTIPEYIKKDIQYMFC